MRLPRKHWNIAHAPPLWHSSQLNRWSNAVSNCMPMKAPWQISFATAWGWANETMKFNEVHSRKSRLLCSRTLHTLEIEKRHGEKWNRCQIMCLRCPYEISDALLYLLLQDMCTWWVVRLWHGTKVMFCQCFNCQSATSCTPLKTNMKPKKRYIPNRKGKSFEPNLHFLGFMLYNCPGCITLKFRKLKLRPDNLEAQMMKVGSLFAGSGEDRSIHVPMKPCKARRFGKERNCAITWFGG